MPFAQVGVAPNIQVENKCPTCHGIISEEDRNRHMERFVAQASLPCKWAGDVGDFEGGCDFQGNRDACSKHEQVCEFRR